MADMLPDLIARLRLDTSEMEAGVGKAAAIGGAIGGAIGSLAASGISAAIDGVREFVAGSVEGFSELEDSTAAAGVVFGDAMGAIIDQSKTAAGQLGLSSQQVINAANTFGTYGKAAGLAGDDLAAFSTDMTGLAGDLASFKGTSTEQAIEAIGAALRGEAEPIRAYGVLLDDATLKAEAMALGISNGTDSLTPQQKVLAAQAAILKQTTDAQGDFARTQDSTANVAKTLAAETENLQAKFGTLLAPAFTAARSAGIDMVTGLSGALDAIIPKAQAFYDRVGPALAGVRDLVTTGDTANLAATLGLEDTGGVIGALSTVRDTIAAVIGYVQGAPTGLLANAIGIDPSSPAFSALTSLRQTVGGVFDAVGGAVSALLPTIAAVGPQVLAAVTAFSPLHLVLEAILPILPQLAETFGGALTTILGALGGVLPVVGELAGVLSGVLASAMQSLAPVIATVATALAGALGAAIGAIAPALVQLAPVVGQLAAMLGSTLTTVIAALAPIIVQLAGVIAALLPPVLGLIQPILSVVTALLPLVGVVGQLIGAILPPLLDLFMAILVPVAELAGTLASALAPILQLVASIISGALVPILSTVIGWVSSLITWVLNLAGPALGGLVSILGRVIGWVANVVASFTGWVSSLGGARAAVQNMATAVGQGISNVVQFFRDLPGNVVSAIGNLGSRLLESGRNAIQGFINGITGMAGNIISAIRNTITDKLPGFVKDALGIKSPSRVFRKLGQQTGQGFAIGITDSVRGVEDATDRMVSAVADANVAPPSLMAAPVNAARAAGAGNALPGAGAAAGAGLSVRVFIGDTELTGMIRTEVVGALSDEADAIQLGGLS